MTTLLWADLLWCLIPVVLVCAIYVKWQGNPKEVLYATARMTVQLVAVGYVLVSIFEHPSPYISSLIVLIMLVVAAWIAIRPVKHINGFFKPAAIALGISVILHLAITLSFILTTNQWYHPSVLIPLAGMYFANSMNAISLAAERYHSELTMGNDHNQARITAFHAAMIPQINGLLAVGVVALPGMMTGQILSGVSPLIAVRYQIMIMVMILGTSGVGAAIMLHLLTRKKKTAN